MPTEDIRPGDIFTFSDGRVGLVISVHENEYGVFYNTIVNGDLVVVTNEWKKEDEPYNEFNSNT